MREKLLRVIVENKSSDVFCPVCKGKARKENDPNFPMSDLPKSNDVTGIDGIAFCETPGCPVCEEQEPVSWLYRTGEVASQQVIPAALVDGVFQGVDEDPDVEHDSWRAV